MAVERSLGTQKGPETAFDHIPVTPFSSPIGKTDEIYHP
jgi:hypothetical protein